MGTARAAAEAVLAEQADEALCAALSVLADAGLAAWVYDPEVANVVGLVLSGTNRAVAVVYLAEQDFEVDEELLSELAATAEPDSRRRGTAEPSDTDGEEAHR